LPSSSSNQLEEVCTEERVFYRIISGLHASIGAHLAARFYDHQKDEWIFNTTLFEERLMKFPDRIENLYFTYVVTLRALTKLSDYLLEYEFTTGDLDNDRKTEGYIRDISTYVMTCPKTFDETSLFTREGSHILKDKWKQTFRNISRIMDCVTCEKCRLWGKIQTSGLGVALKVLFSYDEDKTKNFDYSLQRNEIVALFNTFGRLSESVQYVKDYLNYFASKQPILESLSSSSTIPLESQPIEAPLVNEGQQLIIEETSKEEQREVLTQAQPNLTQLREIFPEQLQSIIDRLGIGELYVGKGLMWGMVIGGATVTLLLFGYYPKRRHHSNPKNLKRPKGIFIEKDKKAH